MRYNIPIALIEFPFGKNEIGSKYAYFNGECFFTKNRKPRIVETNYTITAVVDLGNGKYNLSIAEDTDTLDKNDVLIDNNDKFIILGINDIHTLTVTSKTTPLISTITTVLADSTYKKGEYVIVDPNETYYVYGVELTTIDTVDKKKNLNISEESNSGGGGSCEFTNPTPTPVTQGGIEAGSTFNAVPCETMWERFLYPYQSPAFSSFYINGQSGTIEVGDTSLANPDFRWSTTNSGNVQANSIAIRDATAGSDMATGLANDGQETITASGITNNAPTTQTYTIRGTNTQSNSFNRNYNIYWRWRMYYGEDAATTLDESGIKALRDSLLTNTFARTYSLLGGATYKYIVYPASFGTATTFTDTGTGFAIAMEAPYTVSVTNSFGQTTNYNVHRTTNILNSAINIAVS